MLRKGMVHTIGKLWTKHFPDCPVSVSTACTAEDALRAARLEAFDLIICDHHFNHDDSNLKKIIPGDPAAKNQRPALRCDGRKTSPEAMRKDVRTFFEEERFTIEEDDGALLGLDALIQISESSLLTFSTPVLMLVSGHKVDVEPRLGIIVVQKPLKHSEFISSLERHALDLLQAGRLDRRGSKENVEASDSQTSEKMVNSNGSQLFVRSNRDDS